MTSFKLAFHSVTLRRMVEVWEGDEMIACIYPDERGINVVSKFALEARDDPRPPNAIKITIQRAERSAP